MTATCVDSGSLQRLIEDLFVALGASKEHAAGVAEALVTADLEGVASHGVMLVPLYVERVRAGSVCLTATPVIVEDHGGLVVMSAGNALGQVSSQRAVDLAIERAHVHGLSSVAVRDAFHFGAAGYWARKFARVGMIGFAFSNTRPLMPAPGGAERVIGNNPLAIAFPSASGDPLVIDMAMSATAMGKIRLAQAQGSPIPPGWASDADGQPTVSATEAINGMLLPAAGPKGFGLAVAIDLLCGALSGGGFGAGVRPLYGELERPYNCAHTFIAIDARRVGGGIGIGTQVATVAQTIRDSRKAPSTSRLYAPGDLERAHLAEQAGRCAMAFDLLEKLNHLAQQAGIAARLQPINS